VSLCCHDHDTHPFYGPLDFVRDYLDEPLPEPIWILLKQETVSGSGTSRATCKSAPPPVNHTNTPPLGFYRPDALPAAKMTDRVTLLGDRLTWAMGSRNHALNGLHMGATC